MISGDFGFHEPEAIATEETGAVGSYFHSTAFDKDTKSASERAVLVAGGSILGNRSP